MWTTFPVGHKISIIYAKRFIYAFLYGAGGELLGSILEPKSSPAKQMAVGKKLRAKLLKNLPALKRLIDDVKAAAKRRGYLIGLDGRKLHVRSQHAALNLLLQSAGSLIVKKATCILHENLTTVIGLTFGVEYWNAAHVHDEYQIIVQSGIAELVGEAGVKAFRAAGEFFNFRCPIDGEYKIGRNWAETH